jgi:hypothetical protein
LRSGSDGREVSRRERAPERVELIVGTNVIDGWRGLARSEGGIRLGQLEPGSAQTVCQAPVRFLSCCTPEIGDLLGDGDQDLTAPGVEVSAYGEAREIADLPWIERGRWAKRARFSAARR